MKKHLDLRDCIGEVVFARDLPSAFQSTPFWDTCTGTVDGRNPANHRECIKPVQSWDKRPYQLVPLDCFPPT